jgi:uncharacterized membrane protein YhaH (DUF805 family)
MNQKMSLKQVLFSFTGRIPRSTFWSFYFVYMGLFILAFILDLILGTYSETSGIGLFIGLLTLAGIVPFFAIYIKRCHDRDQSGWFLLVGLIPILGGLWLLMELGILRGTVGENHYGPDPLKPLAKGMDSSIARH